MESDERVKDSIERSKWGTLSVVNELNVSISIVNSIKLAGQQFEFQTRSELTELRIDGF